MTRDINKEIIYIEYTFLNLPTYIEFSGGKKISYIYDTKGSKLKAVYQTALPSSELILDYCDLSNQCAQVVQGSLKAAGINLFNNNNYSMHVGGQRISIPSSPYTPQATFSILQQKYKGKLITRKKKR